MPAGSLSILCHEGTGRRETLGRMGDIETVTLDAMDSIVEVNAFAITGKKAGTKYLIQDNPMTSFECL